MPHVTGAVEPRRGALDCAGVVAEVLRRRFGAEAREAFIDASRGGGLDAFEEVERANELADVVVSINSDGKVHVSALVSTSPPRVASSAYGHGVHVTRLSQVARVQQILRYAG